MGPDFYSSHAKRYKSFSGYNDKFQGNAMEMSLAGFIYCKEENTIFCPFCKLKLNESQPVIGYLAWHKVFSKECPFLIQNPLVNVEDLGVPFPKDFASSNDPQNSAAGNDVITFSGGSNTQIPASTTELNKQHQAVNYPSKVIPKQTHDVIRKSTTEQSDQSLNYEANRKKMFGNWSNPNTPSTRSLAASGFIPVYGTEDTVECVYCKVLIDNWNAEMVPDVVHRKKSKLCPFMKGSTTVKNIPDMLADVFEVDPTTFPPNSLDLGIKTEPTKHPEFAVETRRKETFLTWPTANHKLASEMIEHALFYSGYGDVVCCFSCGVEMFGWSSTDNIWIRHARQAPHCQLVIEEKGADWVAAILEDHGPYQTPEPSRKVMTVTDTLLKPRMDSLAVQGALANPAYSRAEAIQVVTDRIKDGNDFKFSSEVIKAIEKLREDRRRSEAEQRVRDTEPSPPQVVCPPHLPGEDEEESPPEDCDEGTSAIVEDPPYPLPPGTCQELAINIKNQLMCKVCLSGAVGVLFQPCGHLN